jgi:hypothetical protein
MGNWANTAPLGIAWVTNCQVFNTWWRANDASTLPTTAVCTLRNSFGLCAVKA